jgi:hypothetical protein
MPDAPRDPNSSDSDAPFSSSFEGPESPFEGPEAPSWEGEDGPAMGDEFSPSFAADMARLWVQRHQKATMLGAFWLGVFLGALLRD